MKIQSPISLCCWLTAGIFSKQQRANRPPHAVQTLLLSAYVSAETERLMKDDEDWVEAPHIERKLR